MFIVYFKTGCPHSIASVDILEEHSLKFDKRSQDETDDSVPVSYTTFPRVLFEHNKQKIFIGGNKELQEFLLLKNKLINDSTTKIKAFRYLTKFQICYILSKII
jgi:hypothetical protein